MAQKEARKGCRWSTTASALLASMVELSVLTWLALIPLRSYLPELHTLRDWVHIYGIAYANTDVWLACVLRTFVVWVLVLCAPTRPQSRYGDAPTASHAQLHTTIGVLGSMFELIIMGKSAMVAVSAPEALWPIPADPAEGIPVPFAGLVYVYASLIWVLIGSLIQVSLADALISAAQDRYETPPDRDSLEAPLLGGAQGATSTGEGTSKDAGEGMSKGKASEKAAADKKKEERKAKVSGKTVWALIRLSTPEWPMLAVAFGFGSLAALAQATIPYYTGLVIDYASIEPDSAKFKRTIILLVIFSAACGVTTGCRGGLFTIAMSRLNVRIRKKLFHALLSMEIGFFDVTKTGEITSRLATDTSTVSNQVCLNLNVMIRSLTQAAMVLAFMFVASWRLTVVTFILVPVVMMISKVYGRYFASLAKKVQAELAEANGMAEEVLSSMTTVKAHAAELSAEATYSSKLDKFFAILVQESVAYGVYMTANTFLPNAVSAIVLFYGGHLVLSREMSPGALVSFMLYQQSLSSAFQGLGDVFSALTAAVGAADKVLELIARKPQVAPSGSLAPDMFSGHIELKDVYFSYPARPTQQVLRGLSLEVPPGQVVALVGSSGGGKSSIVKLVERFYLPQSGMVLLDGRDVGVYDARWLKRQVALVSQEPVLYARSVRRNICYGLEAEDGVTKTPTQEEVENAAKEANAHDFITSFPNGYDTDCGEKGVTLSGGQKQRLAIARALVRRPTVLLLDEATSALDADSEAVVQEALDRVMAGRTVLVIAHRLSTVQEADKIIVVGAGVVQEVGTHDELLASQGVYASLVRRQIAKSQSVTSFSLGPVTDQLTVQLTATNLRNVDSSAHLSSGASTPVGASGAAGVGAEGGPMTRAQRRMLNGTGAVGGGGGGGTGVGLANGVAGTGQRRGTNGTTGATQQESGG